MNGKSSYRFSPFKIRNISDQRFLVTWTLVIFLASVLLTIYFTAGEIHWIIKQNYFSPSGFTPAPGDENRVPEPAKIPPWMVFGSDKVTFILLGYDSVDEFAHRSDTLMVGAVDFYARKVRIVSIPRDTLVHIPGRGFNRINAAYALGHEDLTRRTVEQFTGVEIDYIVSVNYDGFVEVVDALGGVDMTVEHAMHYDDRRGDVHIHFDPGDYHFDGQQALEYARFRHDATGDFGRIERQQNLIMALFSQAVQPSNWKSLANVADIFLENISVVANENSPRTPPEISLEHVLSLIGFLTQLDDEKFSFSRIETLDIMWQGWMCLIPNYTRTSRILTDVFSDDDPIAWKIALPEEVEYVEDMEEQQSDNGGFEEQIDE